MNCGKKISWTDSEVTMGNIMNLSKKIQNVCCQQIKLIREHSEAEQWHYMNTKVNPADYISRGISMGKIVVEQLDKVE